MSYEYTCIWVTLINDGVKWFGNLYTLQNSHYVLVPFCIFLELNNSFFVRYKILEILRTYKVVSLTLENSSVDMYSYDVKWQSSKCVSSKVQTSWQNCYGYSVKMRSDRTFYMQQTVFATFSKAWEIKH